MRTKLVLFLLLLLTPALANGASHPLLRFVPGEPLVCLSFEDLPALYETATSQPAYQAHAESDDRKAFDQSKLALKLGDRIGEFGKFIGHDVNMKTLVELSGNHTVLALYDIGNLTFLLISDLDAQGQAALAYLDAFRNLDTRKVGEHTFHVKEDPQAGLAFAFHQSEGMLMLSNDITLLEKSLSLRTGDPRSDSFADSPMITKASSDPGVIEAPAILVLDMEHLRDDRYFRYYWVYQNHRLFSNVDAVISGIRTDKANFSEHRLLLGTFPAASAIPRTEKFDGAWWAASGEQNNAITEAHRFLGWPQTEAPNWEKEITGALYAFRGEQDKLGVVRYKKGVALLLASGNRDSDWTQLIEDASEKSFIISNAVPKFRKEGELYISQGPKSMPPAFIAQRGNLLFAANDHKTIHDLMNQVQADQESGEIEIASVPLKKTIPLLNTALDQMGPRGTFEDYGAGFFLSEQFTGLLTAVGNFDSFNFNYKRIDDGTAVQDVHYR